MLSRRERDRILRPRPLEVREVTPVITRFRTLLSCGRRTPGSTDCQPVLPGSLPGTCVAVPECVATRVRQAAGRCRLAACAPRTTTDRRVEQGQGRVLLLPRAGAQRDAQTERL